MKSVLCTGSVKRQRLAVALCSSSSLLMSLEALKGDACAWMGLTSGQSFALSSVIATTSVFLATYILAELSSAPKAEQLAQS